jgi:ATP-dependent RNA helicase DeaD
MSSFESLSISRPLISVCARHGITTPTPIQEQLIPLITSGRDVLAQSETGSGKTLSFALPLIDAMHRRDGLLALVLAPTRELALQIANEFIKFSSGKHLGITPVYGGVSINEQVKRLRTTNIIVGTPGRLVDLLNRGTLHLDTVRFLIFDEADRMLDMGFLPDIERIVKHVPTQRQTLLLSATLPKEIIQISQKYLTDPELVELQAAVKPEFLRQTYYQSTPELRLPLLIHLLKAERDLALVFCNRKHVTSKVAKRLTANGVHARCLHGDLSQSQREKVTAGFRQKQFNVLIATDVAARGLHIDDITHVYNFEIPRDVDSYTHRIGRTARAGKQGEAISIVSTSEERQFFKQILFTYGGQITLKSVSNSDLPELAEQKGEQHTRTQRHQPREQQHQRGEQPHPRGEQQHHRGEHQPREQHRKREDRHRRDEKRHGQSRTQHRGRHR